MMIELLPLLWWFPPALPVFLGIYMLLLWMRNFDDLSPHERELGKAAHGIGVIVCGAYILISVSIPEYYRLPTYGAYAALCCLGLFWFFIGSARAQIFGDRRLQTRAAMKFAMGWAFFAVLHFYLPHVPRDWRGYLAPCLMTTCLWCWSTGLVQLVICSRRRPRLRQPPPDDPVPPFQGGATWGKPG
jgi:hypothetical protein